MPYRPCDRTLLRTTSPRPSSGPSNIRNEFVVGPCAIVFCSIVTSGGPLSSWNARPAATVAPSPANRLFRISTRASVDSGCPSSQAAMFTPLEMSRSSLSTNATSSTRDQGAVPSWLRGVSTIAKPCCASGPVAREAIALDQHAAGVLQLQQVLHDPLCAVVLRMLPPPTPRPRDVVVADLDIGRHETRQPRIAAAEHHVLAGGLQVVVDDLERAGAAPADDRLGIIPFLPSDRPDTTRRPPRARRSSPPRGGSPARCRHGDSSDRR